MSNKIRMSAREFLHGLKDRTEFFNQLIKIHGDVFTIQVLNYTVHFFANPTYIKHVLMDNADDYEKVVEVFGMVGDMIGEYGMFITNNQPIWKKDRTVLNRTFFEANIKKSTPHIVDTIETLLNTLSKHAEDGSPINIHKTFTFVALQNLLKVFYSNIDLSIDDTSSLLSRLAAHSIKYEFSQSKFLALLAPATYFDRLRIRKEVDQLGDRLVDYCMAADSDNIIKQLVEAYKDETGKSQMSRKHMVENALTFLFAGYETTAAALSWAFIYMSLHPQIERTMREEVMNTIGNRKPTAGDLQNLPYITSVFNETVRMQPSILTSERRALKDDNVGAFRLRKGDIVVVPILQVQRLPQYWPNPEGFDPARFSKPLGEEYKSAYIPFGAGPRSCIGRHFSTIEVILTLVMFLQKYKLCLLPGTNVIRETTVVNKPKFDLEMTVHSY